MFVAHHAVPRHERLLHGGIKNLLSGVTTVAHHDPLHPELLDADFPVRVLARYGWSHSLAMDGEQRVLQSHRETPGALPWIIHAAEGTDTVAEEEFERLHLLGCITSNTVIVHGTAMSGEQHRRLAQAGGSLVWCPSSNLHLFGRTVDVAAMEGARRHVVLGSDSRLSGGPDLLAELRLARETTSLDEPELEAMVTERAARALRLEDRGALRIGALADIIVLPASTPLSHAVRADVGLVLMGGVPRYADPKYAYAFDLYGGCARVEVDGRVKCLLPALVRKLRNAGSWEPGLIVGPERAPSRPVHRMPEAAP